MSESTPRAFDALERFTENQRSMAPTEAEPLSLADAARRELAAVYRLLDAARLVVDGADWDATFYNDPPQAPVQKHHLVLLEAAIGELTGERAASPDGYPHAGSDVSAAGVCDAGCCPCHDERRAPQPALIAEAAAG